MQSADAMHIRKQFNCRACGGRVQLVSDVNHQLYTLGRRTCMACCFGWNPRKKEENHVSLHQEGNDYANDGTEVFG
jgi:hypothetical protein